MTMVDQRWGHTEQIDCPRSRHFGSNMAILVGHTHVVEDLPPTDFDWYIENYQALVARYPRRHIAIYGNHVLADGKTALEAYEKAKKLLQKNIRPLLVFLDSPDLSF